MPLQLIGDELAQGGIALGAEAKIVDGELRSVTPQYARGRFDQPLDRDLLRVVVAANKIVFGVRRPAWRGGRQIGTVQLAEIEGGGVHGRFLWLTGQEGSKSCLECHPCSAARIDQARALRFACPRPD